MIYNDQKPLIDALNDAQAGMLLKALIDYHTDGIEDCISDALVNMAFMVMKSKMDADAEKYHEKCIKARESVNTRYMNKRDEYKELLGDSPLHL